MKRLYLDVCTYCRPFDYQNFVERLESDAFFVIMQHVKDGRYQIMISPVHFKEVEAISPLNKDLKKALLNRFETKAVYDSKKAHNRAEELYALRFGIVDAAHIAYAEQMADVFISCDDGLLERYQKISPSLPAMNPIAFSVSEGL
ncbi:hypothetical protein THIOM_004518 [Candidatus Thiomargarita nelsonii]|uniref:PIN domain-containing protein n=1 Tax=Candidatus Thiomargarita nelsonii TaxID=1003181 RepID=A0A176RVN9_9GAMM|nr:hypothetical protein THIOM_004518 [Candidatus Thiomargarita nelsonii]